MISNGSTTAPPDPPPHLNSDATWKWRETWSRLDHDRFDACRDGDVLAQYCQAWADIREADSEIKKLARIRKTKTGTVVPAQGLTEASRFYGRRAAAMQRFDQVGEQLGLSLYAPPSTPWSRYLSLLQPLPQELADRDNKEPGRPRVWTLKRLWTALQRSWGNMAAAARLLSETYGVTCTPARISLLTKKYPQLREAIEESEVVLFELCKGALTRCAIAGDDRAQEFLLTRFDPRFKSKTKTDID